MTKIAWEKYLSNSNPLNSKNITVKLLRALVIEFRTRVPFENIDVILGVKASTDVSEIANKILNGSRGGWCYEVNLLLADLLRDYGFPVAFRMARVGYRRPNLGPLSHLLLAVTIDDEEWLVDAGFGGPGPLDPIPLKSGEWKDSHGCLWLLEDQASQGLTPSRWMAGQWQRLYAVTPLEILPADIEVASYFLSHSDSSPFRRRLMAVAFDGEAFWCLEELSLVQRSIHWEELSRLPMQDARDLSSRLATKFGINIPLPACETIWSCCG